LLGGGGGVVRSAGEKKQIKGAGGQSGERGSQDPGNVFRFGQPTLGGVGQNAASVSLIERNAQKWARKSMLK